MSKTNDGLEDDLFGLRRGDIVKLHSMGEES